MTAPWDELPKLAEESVTVVPGKAAAAVLGDPRSLLVLSQSFLASYLLPDSGEVTIGRSSSVEIYVDDPLVSRRHAIIATTPTLSLRDLGSSNGTRLHGAPVPPGAAQALNVGDVILVGTTALLVQQRARVVAPRRFWDREHLAARLREECARAERTGGRFTLACLQVTRNAPDVGVRQVLASALRTSDVVGEWGPGAYALLITDASTDQARAVLDRVATGLARCELTATWATAHYPGDGTTGDELLARAQPQVEDRGPAVVVSEGRVIADAVTQELYRVAERIAAGDISVLILGDNIYHGHGLPELLASAGRRTDGAGHAAQHECHPERNAADDTRHGRRPQRPGPPRCRGNSDPPSCPLVRRERHRHPAHCACASHPSECGRPESP